MKFRHTLLATLLLALCAGCMVSCGDDEDSDIILGGGDGPVNPSPNPNPQPDPNPTPDPDDKPTVTGEAARLEMPRMIKGTRFVTHHTQYNGKKILNFALEYDPQCKHSRWVAFRFDNDTRAKNVGRKDYDIKPQYPRDPELNSNEALPSDLSFGRGYDHGHLCASADRLFSREGNDQTFYMSNMSPQISNFNQKYWTTLEQHVQKLGRDRSFADTLYVVKGGTITKGNTIGTIKNGATVIPKYYYMALLKVRNNGYQSIGFLIEHKNYGSKNAPLSDMKKHIVSIDELEHKTGIDFFHNLPDHIENLVEKQKDSYNWGF